MLSLLWTICLVVNANAQGSGIQDDTVLQNTYRDMKELNSGLKRDFELERLAQSVEGCVNNIDQLKRTNKIVLEDRGQFEAIFSCALPGCIEGQSWSRNDPLGAWRAFRTITGQYGQILDKNNKYVGCSATKNDPGVCLWCYLSKNPGQNRQEEDNTGINQQDCQDNDDIDIGNIGGRTTVICQNGKDNKNKQNSIPKQQDCLENDDIDIGNIGGRTTVICQNGKDDRNKQTGQKISSNQNGQRNPSNQNGQKPSSNQNEQKSPLLINYQITNIYNNGSKGLCIKPEVVAGNVDVVFDIESDEVMLIKVTCFSEYILYGDVYLKCQGGFWSSEFPICTRLPSGPQVRNSGRWKPDGRKGECGRPISSRANIDQLVKTVEDFDDLFISYTYGRGYVSGSFVPQGKYPWMALLGYDPFKKEGSDNFYLCGGSLINKHYVLTAAHCIYTVNGPVMEVILGEHVFNTDEDCEYPFCNAPIIKRQINANRDVIVHERFNETGNLEYDIALIRIEEAVPLHQENEFQSSVSPICLPWNTNLDEETQDDRYAIGAGWGRTVGKKSEETLQNVLNNNINIDHLQELGLPIANEKCKNDPMTTKIIRVFDPEIQICAGGIRGEDSCNGDSGGPLMVYKNDVTYQIGLVSFGTKPCGAGIPGVYTKVTKFLPWIAKNLKA